jgi:hypothetical protein
MKNRTNVALLVIGALAALTLAAFGGAKLADGDEDDEPQVVLTTGAGDPETTPTAAATDEDGADDLPPADDVTEPDDRPLGRAEAARAGAAAARSFAGATVVDVDRSDDPGEAYEVELMTDRGEIDVALDSDFSRVRNAAYDD